MTADQPAHAVRTDAPGRIRRWPRSTTTRIALVVFAALVGSNVIILGFVGRVTERQLSLDARALIASEREEIAEVFASEGVAGASTVISAELHVPGPLVILLADPAGRPLAGNLPAWPGDLVAGERFRQRLLQRINRPASEPFAVTTAKLPRNYRLLVGRSLKEEERLTATLTATLVAAIGLALVLAVAISFVLTRIIAGRVRSIADVAGAVAAGDLSRRVDVPIRGSGDAFDLLGSALNTMLARIEALLDELRSVTDGLAHDLRSPLTRMKARIDRLGRSPENIAETAPGEIAAIGAEADALLAMLDNSLEISRVEAGIGRDNFVTMDLAALVTDMVEMYEPLAEDSGIALTALAAHPVQVRGHRELLGRTLSNLIDNALRYGASGRSIEVSAAPTTTGAELIVADHGPGIAPASHDEALRRFGRLDGARPAGGAGLGLSLAAAIARLHGGALTLADNQPGLRVTVTLPAQRATVG